MARAHPHLYEISTVPWLHELSQREGRPVTLGSVPASEWDRLEKLGFDYVWLMGVWQKSQEGRKIFQESKELYSVYESALPGWNNQDIVGSPYSISSYEPDLNAGSNEELKEVREQLAKRGIGLILDFVPNHLGPDHPWVKQHPEYFIQGDARRFEEDPEAFFQVDSKKGEVFIAKGRDPYFPPWKDTVQLNYFEPATRAAMIKQLKNIHQYCDGVRCDMAMLVLNDIFSKTWGDHLAEPEPAEEFWSEAREALPEMIWIAEAYWDTEWTLQQLGFNYVYDKRLYDRSRFSSAQDIRLHLTADLDYQAKLLRFVENHDEPRCAAEFTRNRLFAAITLFATLPGTKLYNHGQFEGRKIHLPVQMLRVREEEVDTELYDYHMKLLEITNDRCFHEGNWTLLDADRYDDDSHHHLICYLWKNGKDARLVVVNMGAGHSQGRVQLSDTVDADKNYSVQDLLSGEEYERSGEEMAQDGLHVVLKPYQSHILAFGPKST